MERIARPRIQRIQIDVESQSQRIIRVLSELYEVRVHIVSKLYYRFNEDVQVTKFHLKRMYYAGIDETIN